jgi:hypothetical protein
MTICRDRIQLLQKDLNVLRGQEDILTSAYYVFIEHNKSQQEELARLDKVMQKEKRYLARCDELHKKIIEKTASVSTPQDLEGLKKITKEWQTLLTTKSSSFQENKDKHEKLLQYLEPFKKIKNDLMAVKVKKEALMQELKVQLLAANKHLHKKIMLNQHQEVKELLKVGANPNFVIDGRTPLYLAIKNEDAIQVEELLKHKADPDLPIACPDFVGTPLIATVILTYNNTRILKALLEHGAAINKQSKNDFTPLHAAISTLATEHTCVLVERGALFSLQDKYKRTPLDILEQRKNKNLSSYKAIKKEIEKNIHDAKQPESRLK